MGFIDQIKELSVQISEQLEYVQNEEATKTALIQPFIEALGYDVSDLRDVEPEYTCDFQGKKGKKVDYAINRRDEKPFMVFECKSATEILKGIHADQLHFYFYYNKARFAVLTNGVMYKFFT